MKYLFMLVGLGPAVMCVFCLMAGDLTGAGIWYMAQIVELSMLFPRKNRCDVSSTGGVSQSKHQPSNSIAQPIAHEQPIDF